MLKPEIDMQWRTAVIDYDKKLVVDIVSLMDVCAINDKLLIDMATAKYRDEAEVLRSWRISDLDYHLYYVAPSSWEFSDIRGSKLCEDGYLALNFFLNEEESPMHPFSNSKEFKYENHHSPQDLFNDSAQL